MGGNSLYFFSADPCDLLFFREKKMRHSSTNPPTNVIPPGIEEPNLVRAVEMSGYPLQGIVAEKLLLGGFTITEEWGFIDSETQEHRSLDLRAFQFTGNPSSGSGVIPQLTLLIECKRTGHPYVFFRRVSDCQQRAGHSIARRS